MKIKLHVVIAVALTIQGCAGGRMDGKTSSDALSEIKAVLADSAAQSARSEAGQTPPPEVSDALLPKPAALPGAMQSQPMDERFDISVNRMPAKLFFMSLVHDTSINLVVHPDVSGYVSLDLKSVTIDEVLEVTRDVYGYEYQKNRAGYYILPAKMRSKIFNVGYLNVQRKGESNTKVSSGQFVASNRNSGLGSDSQRTTSSLGGTEVPSSKVTTKSDADFWTDIRDTISTLIGTENGRAVVVNPQSGLVVVRAMPNELRDVEDFLNSAQNSLTRQVIIEAKVIEVQLNDQFQAGVNWAKLEEKAARTSFGGQFLFNGKTAALVDDTGKLVSGNLVNDDLGNGFNNFLAVGTATDDFAYILTLLDSQGDVNVLSSPRVSTVNNQKAVIKVGSDEYFVTGLSSTTTTGTSTSTTPEVELTPFFSGIALDVTPQINQQEDVILHIHPSISEVVDQIKDITIFGVDQSLPLAFSTVRESDSIVRARSGQVIIIGGLMQTQTSEVEGGVPGLRKIPLLGNLFKQQKKVSKRSELVILLKPTVIGADGRAWQSELERVSSRVNALQR